MSDLLIQALRETATTEKRIAIYLVKIAAWLEAGELTPADAAILLLELATIIRDGSSRLAEFLP